MRKIICRFLFVSSLMSLCLAFSAIDAFAQCGADGTQPCNTTPKKTTPKPTTKPKPKPTVSKPTTPTKKPPTNVVKPKPVTKSSVACSPSNNNNAPSNFTQTINGVKFQMVGIPSGSFCMGSNNVEDDEKPVHKVIISQAFWMGRTEVTQAQWKAVMGNNPGYFKGDDLPVEQVSWDNVKDFIRKLNNLQNDYEYRLPTEAEWEYAARAGTTTRYSYGDGEGSLDSYAWYSANSGSKTHEVATKQPNAFGLYDMHGNVWEWCQDWYGNYSSGAVTNPTGAGTGSHRVGRGGGWGSAAAYLRSAYRFSITPSFRDVDLGFRVVRY
ncbi:MAG: formylglycine-generating enzyme family protein [Pyrinomonadaceae bacterium]